VAPEPEEGEENAEDAEEAATKEEEGEEEVTPILLTVVRNLQGGSRTRRGRGEAP